MSSASTARAGPADLAALTGHRDLVLDIAYSPDGILNRWLLRGPIVLSLCDIVESVA